MRRLTRREAIAAGALGLGAGVGAYVLLEPDDDPNIGPVVTDTEALEPASAGSAEGGCVLTPEQTEGPYYVDDAIVRRDVREDREGAELDLELKVQSVAGCEPLEDATVEIWHADAEGVYSAFGEGAGETFLRGAQPTNSDGVASFTTIYPGWYAGRTVHIHVKVHVEGDEVHTGQLYFDDEVTDRVYEAELYASRGERDVRNDADGIYTAGGEASLVAVTPRRDGYSGTLTMGVET